MYNPVLSQLSSNDLLGQFKDGNRPQMARRGVDLLLTINEASNYLGCSAISMHGFIKAGSIMTFPRGREVLIPR